jgi:hypothetical protein
MALGSTRTEAVVLDDFVWRVPSGVTHDFDEDERVAVRCIGDAAWLVLPKAGEPKFGAAKAGGGGGGPELAGAWHPARAAAKSRAAVRRAPDERAVLERAMRVS